MQQQINVHPTHHANCRAQQRGLRGGDLSLVAAFADRELHASGGCEYWGFGLEGKHALLAAGVSPQRVDRLSRLAIIINVEHGIIVTVFPATSKWRRKSKRGLGRPCRRTLER